MADNRDLVNTIIAEAGGGGKEGITAATWAIAQRAAARGQTMDQVIRSGFDGFTNPGPGSVKAQQNQALRNQVEQIIQGVQRGDIPNPVPGADHFLSGDANPSWSKGMKLVATIDGQRYYASGQVPKSAQGVGLPPGELPSVASLLDTKRPAPTPAIQSPNAAFLRQNTSPLGDNTGLQAALQQVATTKANAVSPQTRSPQFSAMGTPDLGSIYAGIYPQQAQSAVPRHAQQWIAARQIEPQGRLTAPSAIGSPREGGAPTAVQTLAGTLLGNRDTITESNFTKDETEALKQVVLNAEKDGRNYITYEDYFSLPGFDLKDFDSSNLLSRVFDTPAESVRSTLGRANFTRDSRGNIIVSDKYDFNAAYNDTGQPLYDTIRRGAGLMIPEDAGRAVRAEIPFDKADGFVVREGKTSRVAPRGSLTAPGAVDASVASAGANTNSALKAALTRLAGGSNVIPQSQIERGTTPITPVSAPAVAPKPRVTVSTPFTTPQSNIERGAARTVAPSTIGQPPATRVVQSIPMPALAAAATSIPQSYAGQDGGAPRIAPAPDRLAPSKGLPELFGNAAIGGADIMRFGVPSEVVAPVPAARPATFRTELRPMQISNPAWKPTPAVGTPMSGGLSRDAVALRAKGLAQAQAMAQVPRMITVQRPVQVAIQPRPVAAALAQQPLRIAVNGAGVAPQPLTVVQQLRAQGLSPAAAYAAANGGSGSINNSDAASRINGSSSRGSGGARSLLD